MKKEIEENYIVFYQEVIGRKEPQVRKVKVADSGEYWEIKIYTKDNPTFEVDQIG